MKRLILFRHAKSAWDDPSLRDFDRPLAPRGRAAAPRVAAWLHQAGYIPDLVLCSAAKRAMQTWESARDFFPAELDVRTSHDLYLARPDRILQFVRAKADDAGCVMVIAHNPGLELLAQRMAADGRDRDLRRIESKFPTAAAAVFDFDVDDWNDARRGHLVSFVRPKDLPKSD